MKLKKYLPLQFITEIEGIWQKASDITLIKGKNMFLSISGSIYETDCLVSEEILGEIVSKICKGSMYANQSTMKNGFVTIEGGHRVGVTGTLIKDDCGNPTHLKSVTAINIRISRCIDGAANKIMPFIKSDNRVYNTLIIAPPGAGKTTLLRDIAVQLGDSFRVGIVDERSEIAAGYNVGKYTFVIENSSKHDGILMLLRSMSPQVIITDEIGTEEDETAIEKLLNAGVKTICTAHGYNEKDILRRKPLKNLVFSDVFERVIVLSNRMGPGTVEKIINIQEWKKDA